MRFRPSAARAKDHHARDERDIERLPDERANQRHQRENTNDAGRNKPAQRDMPASGADGQRNVGGAHRSIVSHADRKQAFRANRQHDRHEQIDQHRCDSRARRLRQCAIDDFAQKRRQVRAANGIDDADDERTIECAANRAYSAGNQNDQCQDENWLAHSRLHRQDRRGHHASQTRERCADCEDKCIDQLDVHTEGGQRSRHPTRQRGSASRRGVRWITQ